MDDRGAALHVGVEKEVMLLDLVTVGALLAQIEAVVGEVPGLDEILGDPAPARQRRLADGPGGAPGLVREMALVF